MPHSAPINDQARQGSIDRWRRALAEAVAGLEAIRDEGPSIDPAYPQHGTAQAREAWAFDSASHERAQTARGALERVAAITER